MRRRIVIDVLAALGGFAALVFCAYYFTWATSLSQPVDWANTASSAFVFGPLGMSAGIFADIAQW